MEDKHPTLPAEVWSTGLPYLIVPIRGNLEKARIVSNDLEDALQKIGARYDSQLPSCLMETMPTQDVVHGPARLATARWEAPRNPVGDCVPPLYSLNPVAEKEEEGEGSRCF
jgi:hypothetical protein